MKKSGRTPGRPALLVLGVAALAVYAGQLALSQGRPAARRTVIVNGHEAVDGEVLVRFNRAMAGAERLQMERQLDTEESEPVAANTRRFRSRAFDVNTLVNYMRTRGDVDVAEPNYIQYATATPADPNFGSLWGLFNSGQTVNGDPGTSGRDIRAKAAWDVSTGSTANVVAVIDTGIDYNHPDLQLNVWSAPSAFDVTIGGVLVHCAAGTHGFNAIPKTCDPMDDNNHGTHVSGTIGARANNGAGVAGVNWVTSIIGGKFLNASGSGTTSDAINAIEFMIQAKQIFGSAANVRVLSNSWGGGGFSQLLLDEINEANDADMLFVASAGNSAANTDVAPSYPSSFNAPNIVSVAASDNDDFLAGFSNYGATTVDLAAPGVNILSTTRNNGYAYYNGTSMAAPHVSGAAALVLSACALNTAGLKNALMNNVDTVGGLVGRVVTGGRLNVDAAIRSCSGVAPPEPPSEPTNLIATAGKAKVTLSWTAPSGATSFTIKRGTSPGSHPTTVATGVTGTTYTNTNLTNGTTYDFAVIAVGAGGLSNESAEAFATPLSPPLAPTGLTAKSIGSRQISLAWNPSATAASYTVRRATSSSGTYSTIATNVLTTSFVNSGLTKNKRYYYRVVAVNAAGSSPNSNKANAVAK